MSDELQQFADRIRRGEPRALARAISLIEDVAPAGRELVRAIYPHTGHAYLVGVTGPPGAGKSTLVDQLVKYARRQTRSVGVLAVDPSSPFTGGAVLGDRVRMMGHASDEAVFIRSMATRGHLGGLSQATADAAAVLDAAGKDLVVIETVGIGQDEVDIVRTADVTIVVLVPGAGDDVQALKAGLMEIADIFVVNKSDRDGADRLVQTIEASLSLHPYETGSWRPPVVGTIATSGNGISELWDAIRRFRDQPAEARSKRQREREAYRLRELLRTELLQYVDRMFSAADVERIVDDIRARKVDPYSAARQMITGALHERDRRGA